MSHPPGPSGPPPGPANPPRRETPLDPNSAEGRAVAARLTQTLACIEVELAERAAIDKGTAA